MEEEFVQKMCAEVIAFKPDLVITEKGVSDLAQHYFVRAGISVIRRVRKSDNNRIARSVPLIHFIWSLGKCLILILVWQCLDENWKFFDKKKLV